MLTCPICSAVVRESDLECSCGELLTSWNLLRTNGLILRQRGLNLAARGDYVGALVKFLEAALTGPQDEKSVLDAARALVRMDRDAEALELLECALARPATRTSADVLIRAIRSGTRPQPPPEPEPEPTPPSRALLDLGKLERKKVGWLCYGNRPLEPGWDVVLGLEKGGTDWRAEAPWLTNAFGTLEGYGVVHYMLGLGSWQRNESAQALVWFGNCLRLDPPLLNPAAYYVCLCAEEGQGADGVVRLRNEFGFDAREIETCVDVVASKLQETGQSDLANALASLVNQD